jgi:hypothetical protein
MHRLTQPHHRAIPVALCDLIDSRFKGFLAIAPHASTFRIIDEMSLPEIRAECKKYDSSNAFQG